ncbi:MAG: AAA family ATPase [Bacteroidaceae bacterium]|jgi:cytidylate kinase
MENFVINLGRELGSGGREIGRALATHYGIAFYDKELITLAAEESGLDVRFFKQNDERNKRRIMGGIFGMRFPFTVDGNVGHGTPLDGDQLFKVQSDVIRKAAEKGSGLFVGRCADYVLRDHPRAVSIFISAHKEDRLRRISALYGVDLRKAENLMEKADRKRSEYYNFYSLKTWGAAASYDLCINSSVLGVEETVKFLCSFIDRRFGF